MYYTHTMAAEALKRLFQDWKRAVDVVNGRADQMHDAHIQASATGNPITVKIGEGEKAVVSESDKHITRVVEVRP